MQTGNPRIDNSDAEYIIGSDECGYGSWAGPLVVCAALVSKNWPNAVHVRDSKDFSGPTKEAKREEIVRKILGTCLYAIVSVPAPDVDAEGVYKALKRAHAEAIRAVLKKHEATGSIGKVLIVVDGTLDIDVPEAISLPKADALVAAVSAASLIGKVARDQHMRKIAKKYPGYGFDSNKGYNAPAHELGLQKLGPCEIHRKSYAPIARLLEEKERLVSQGSDLFDLLDTLPQED